VAGRGIRMFHVVSMRIAIITESFAPDLNGVANCVPRVAEHLVRRGHEPLIIAPEPAGSQSAGPFPYPVERVASISLPLAPAGEVLAGYIGRLATEKRVDLLAPVAELPGVRLIVVGGGPAAAALRERMPSAIFLGEQRGEKLARTYASLDLFVHSGPLETFGQTRGQWRASRGAGRRRPARSGRGRGHRVPRPTGQRPGAGRGGRAAGR